MPRSEEYTGIEPVPGVPGLRVSNSAPYRLGQYSMYLQHTRQDLNLRPSGSKPDTLVH